MIRKSEYRTRNGGTVGVYVDITQLKQAEVALRVLNAELDQRVTERTLELDVANQQLERLNLELATLIQSAPVAIMALDTAGRICTWNPAAERLTGYTEHETRALPPALTRSTRVIQQKSNRLETARADMRVQGCADVSAVFQDGGRPRLDGAASLASPCQSG